jgi:hypothetical protein
MTSSLVVDCKSHTDGWMDGRKEQRKGFPHNTFLTSQRMPKTFLSYLNIDAQQQILLMSVGDVCWRCYVFRFQEAETLDFCDCKTIILNFVYKGAEILIYEPYCSFFCTFQRKYKE